MISRFFWKCGVYWTVSVSVAILYLAFIHKKNINLLKENDVSKSEKLMSCKDVCLTKECIQAASSLLESIDENKSPCEDFYSFACGKWMAKFTENENHTMIEAMKENLKAAVKEVINEIEDSSESSAGKLKTLYETCVNYSSSEQNAIPSALLFLERLGFEGWPNLALDFEFTNSTLEEVLAMLISHNEFAFMYFHNSQDLMKFSIIADRSLLNHLSQLSFYKSRVRQTLSYFGIPNEAFDTIWAEFRNIDQQIKDLIQDKYNRCEEDCILPLDCTRKNNESLNFICQLLKNVVVYNSFEKNYTINHAYLIDQFSVMGLVTMFSQVTDRSLANYLALRFFLNHLDDLNLYFRLISLRSGSTRPTLFGYETEQLRWKQCAGWLMSNLFFPLGQVYALKRISPKQMRGIRYIFRTLILTSAKSAMKQNWMPERTRIQLNSSLRKIKNLIEQYMSELTDTRFDFIMKKFEPVRDSFFLNVMKHQRNVFYIHLLESNAIADIEYPIDVFDTNAKHVSGSIGLKFGLLLPPVYQLGRSSLLNLVTLGHTIGHEIGHEIEAFFHGEDLDNETIQTFISRKKCLQEQYSDFKLEKIEMKVNGYRTFSENFADLIATQLVERVIDEIQNFDFELPALNFTAKQLTYILITQMWCSASSKEMEQFEYDNDAHAAAYVRINGIMKNAKGFSEAFNCSNGSLMNPRKKCFFFD